MRTKLFTFFFALMASVVTINASVIVDGIAYNLHDDLTAEVTSYENYSGTITIPSTIIYNNQSYSVTSIGYRAFYNCTVLTSIELPHSVTNIGNDVFWGCSGLTSIEIPNSVTSIGDNAFFSCTGLTSIEIPNNVTSIGFRIFYGCSGLTSITLGNSITSIGNSAFAYCSSLTSITIPNSVTYIGLGFFSYCSSLTSIDIPNSVTSIGNYAFSYCSSLTSIEIPNSVTRIKNYAFYNCTWLTSVTIHAPSLTEYGDGAFAFTSGRLKIYVPAASVDTYKTGWGSYQDQIEAIANYYVVGSMTNWAVDENYQMTKNDGSECDEYVFNMDLTPSSCFKVLKVAGDTQTWYPDGTGNAYGENGEITQDANYNIFFRPDADGDEGWFYNIIYIEKKKQPKHIVFGVNVPTNGVPESIELVGSFGNGWEDGVILEQSSTGHYVAYEVYAEAEDEFKVRGAGSWDNEILVYTKTGWKAMQNMKFGNLWTDDTWEGNPVKRIELDLSGAGYRWKQTAVGIENVNDQMRNCENAKIIRDGQVLILRGGCTYSITGQKVK